MDLLVEKSFQELQSAITKPDWLKRKVESSFASFNELGLPSRKDELWKYTNAKKFVAEPYKYYIAAKQRATATQDELSEGSVSFLNGFLDDSQAMTLPKGLLVSPLRECWDDPDLKRVLEQKESYDNAFEALNDAFLDQGLLIKVPKNTQVEQTLKVVFRYTHDEPTLMTPKIVVVVGESSSLNIVESHVAEEGSYFTNVS